MQTRRTDPSTISAQLMQYINHVYIMRLKLHASSPFLEEG